MNTRLQKFSRSLMKALLRFDCFVRGHAARPTGRHGFTLVEFYCPQCERLFVGSTGAARGLVPANSETEFIFRSREWIDQGATRDVVSAAAEEEPDVVQALFAVNIPTPLADGTLPTDIQWMPPGSHTISASKNGKPYKTTINVNSKTADTVQAAFKGQMEKAKTGGDDYPYLDFNHNDEEASAHPSEFYWGGDDPQTGGVRCKVTWTDAGANAVKGRSYRRFSPQFADDGKGNVTGLPLNAGGLVNRAAFKKIQALAAKENSPATNPNEDIPMKKLLALLKQRGLITDTDLDETDLVTQASAKLVTMDGQIAELVTVKTKVTDLEGQITKAKETHAKSVVDGLVKAGAIPPKDDKVQARYIKLLVDDPENEAILPKAPNPALGKAVVNAKRNETPGEDLGTDDAAEPLIVKAKEIAKTEKIDLSDAIVQACEDDEEAYNAFRYANGLGSKKERDAYAAGRN